MYEEITAQAKQAVTELLDVAGLKAGDLFVVGCSSSEVVGARIGKGSSMEAAQAVFDGIYPVPMSAAYTLPPSAASTSTARSSLRPRPPKSLATTL